MSQTLIVGDTMRMSVALIREMAAAAARLNRLDTRVLVVVDIVLELDGTKTLWLRYADDQDPKERVPT